MNNYIGCKAIKAEPMTKLTYEISTGRFIDNGMDITTPGYLVEYPDGYKSWSPKDIFERAYRPITDEEIDFLNTDA